MSTKNTYAVTKRIGYPNLLGQGEGTYSFIVDDGEEYRKRREALIAKGFYQDPIISIVKNEPSI